MGERGIATERRKQAQVTEETTQRPRSLSFLKVLHLFQFLLGAELVGVATLLLAAVLSAGGQPRVAPAAATKNR